MAFIRNDGNPKLSMCIMAVGSLTNIVLDYSFLYPMNMGIFGAALATGLSPVFGLMVASSHFVAKKNGFHLMAIKFDISELKQVTGPGVSSFINEASSSVVLVAYNLLIMKIAGTVGVAAYGIIANLALIVLAVFSGISQGIQPLFSRAHGSGDTDAIKTLCQKGCLLALLVGIFVFCTANLAASDLVHLFNRDQDPVLQAMAESGLKYYFVGFLFVGCNYLAISYFSTTDQIKLAFALSVFRGCIGSVLVASLFAALFGLRGIWSAFPFVEFCTMWFCFFFGVEKSKWRKRKKERDVYMRKTCKAVIQNTK